MGTRSLTHVKDDVWNEGETPSTLVTIYRQMDGYPSGMGKDLAAFLEGAVITNGIGSGDPPNSFNGMGELAAQLVRALKEDNPSGNIYLYPPDSSDVGEEYVYTIFNADTRRGGRVVLKVESTYDGGKVLFEGDPADFDAAFVEKASG